MRNGKDPAAERRAALDAERLARLRQVTVVEAAEQYKAAALSGGTLHHEREASHLALAIAEMNVADTPLPDLARATCTACWTSTLGTLASRATASGLYRAVLTGTLSVAR